MRRATAYRFWIKDLAKGEYVAGVDINNPTHIKMGERKVSRVDLVGKVVEKSETPQSQYSFITIEDKTGKIRVRIFGDNSAMAKDIGQGNLVRVIGRIRQDERERFVIGEIIKKIDDTNYQLLREKELGNSQEDISF